MPSKWRSRTTCLPPCTYYLGDKHHEWEHWQLALPGAGISSSVRVKSLLLGTAGNALRSENPKRR